MAELCKECFIATFYPSKKDIDNIVMSDYDEFCELCTELLPFVDHIAAGWCPECGGELKCMCVIGSDESYSGEEERLYQCEKCLSSWEQTGIHGDLQRKFWG